MVAIPLYLKIGNKSISVTSGEFFDPKFVTALKTSNKKGAHWQKNILRTS